MTLIGARPWIMGLDPTLRCVLFRGEVRQIDFSPENYRFVGIRPVNRTRASRGSGVLLDYANATAAAWTLPAKDRRYSKWLQLQGLAGCLALALMLQLIIGMPMLEVGLGARWRLVR